MTRTASRRPPSGYDRRVPNRAGATSFEPRVAVARALACALAGAAFALALAGCYDPRLGACAVSCATSADCPGALSCAQGRCVAEGQSCPGDDGGGDGDAADAEVPLTAWRFVAAGADHTCAIDGDGALWCWGRNDARQLGVASPARSGDPVRVDIDDTPTTGWDVVSAGGTHTCAVRAGELWCWGDNEERQCGSTAADTLPPTQVADPAGLTGDAWTTVGTGETYTCALRDDGSLWCFGSTIGGQLGTGQMSQVSAVPLAVPGGPWRSIGVGFFHACGVRGEQGARGELLCWGYDDGYGRIGDGGNTSRATPTPVVDDGVRDWQRVASGPHASCALDVDGQVHCWGRTFYIPGTSGSPVPARYGSLEGVDGVVMGGSGGCLIDGGTASCFGFNEEGQLAAVPTWRVADPTPIGGVGVVTQVALGARHACALDDAGALACWGDTSDGQLGDGVISDLRTPTPIPLDVGGWRQVDVGVDHTCATTTLGQAYCWGLNTGPQLGGGAARAAPLYASPLLVDTEETLEYIVAGYQHSCALTTVSGGVVLCWGANDVGQRGVEAPSDYTPAMVDAELVTRLTTGISTSCAVAADDGARRCWGANDYGQLGNGDAPGPQLDTPTDIAGGPSGWTMVSMGVAFACGISAGATPGQLYCWGENGFGRLGQASGLVLAPELVADPTPGVTDGWIDVAAGLAHTCGILTGSGSQGSLWCWGANYAGQAGHGGGDGPTLVRVGTADDWVDVDVAGEHTCALRATGALHCFGDNGVGQLGDGTFENRSSLGSSVGGFTDWVEVSAGSRSSCGVRDEVERTLYCWGEGRYGQLGVGDSVRWVPAPVTHP